MNRSYRLLIICAILFLISGVVFWRGLASIEPNVVDNSEDVAMEVASDSSNLVIADSASVQSPDSGEVARVTKVVDGDTIEIESGGQQYKVRLIGVDTPETVDPRRPAGCFGKEASNESHRLMDNQSVVLVKDVTDKDKYDRLLRYVYVIQDQDNWLFINDYLVRNGFAKSSTYPPDVKYQEQFKEAEIEAREANRGLWGAKCR